MNICKYIITKGVNKGKTCSKEATNGDYCSSHHGLAQANKEKAKQIKVGEVRTSTEVFSHETVEKLLQSVYFKPDDYENQKKLDIQKNQLLKYVKKGKIDGEQITVTVYYDLKEYGRYTSRVGRNDAHVLRWSCMSMPSFIRNVLFNERYYDCDLANCHPVITNATFKHYKLEAPLSGELADPKRRSEIINSIMSLGQVSRKIAKELPLRIFYGGSAMNWFEENNVNTYMLHPEAWVKLENEVYSNIVTLLEGPLKEYLFYAKRMNLDQIDKEEKKRYKDVYSVAWAYYCQDIERHVVTHIWDKALESDLQVGGVIHDGLHLSKKFSEEHMRETLFKDWEESILKFTQEEFGYEIPLKLEIKPLNYNGQLLEKYVAVEQEIPEEETYEGIKEDFETTHFLIEALGEYCCLEEDSKYTLKSKTKMRDTYEHHQYKETEFDKETKEFVVVNKKFIDRWFKDVDKLTYKAIGLYPPPTEVPERHYNLWKGWDIIKHTKNPNKDYTESRNTILEHYKYIGGDGWEYLLKSHAIIAQKPAYKNGIMTTYQSDAEGVGKSSMYEINKAYMGSQYCVKIRDADTELLGGFNALTKHKIYIFLEEFDGNDGKGKAGRKLMEMITTTEDNITHKGKDTFTVKSVSHYEASTNILDPKKISDKNRRDVFYRIEGKAKPKEYFTKLYDLIKNKDIMRDWYDFLMEQKCDDIDWINSRPKGEYFEDLVEASRDMELSFLIDKIVCKTETLASQKAEDWTDKFKTGELFNEFRTFIDSKKIKYDTTDSKFGLKLLKYKDLFAAKSKSKGYTTYKIDYIAACKHLIDSGICQQEDFPFLEGKMMLRQTVKEPKIEESKVEESKIDECCCLIKDNFKRIGPNLGQCKICKQTDYVEDEENIL